MRGKPEQLNAEHAAQAAASRDKFASERESYRAEAEQDAVSEDERFAFNAGHKIGERTERRRILAGLDALLRETAALWFEGTAPTKAVAAYTARVRAVVEGRGA